MRNHGHRVVSAQRRNGVGSHHARETGKGVGHQGENVQPFPVTRLGQRDVPWQRGLEPVASVEIGVADENHDTVPEGPRPFQGGVDQHPADAAAPVVGIDGDGTHLDRPGSCSDQHRPAPDGGDDAASFKRHQAQFRDLAGTLTQPRRRTVDKPVAQRQAGDRLDSEPVAGSFFDDLNQGERPEIRQEQEPAIAPIVMAGNGAHDTSRIG